MVSFISIRILFYVLCLFTILHTINGYYLFDKKNAENTEENHFQHRGVLWPKICLLFLKRYNPNSQFLDENNNHIEYRPIRKCYPFDKRYIPRN